MKPPLIRPAELQEAMQAAELLGSDKVLMDLATMKTVYDAVKFLYDASALEMDVMPGNSDGTDYHIPEHDLRVRIEQLVYGMTPPKTTRIP